MTATAVHCSAEQYVSVVQCTVQNSMSVWCSLVQYSAVCQCRTSVQYDSYCSAVQCRAVRQCSTVHSVEQYVSASAVQYSALCHCCAVQCSAVQYVSAICQWSALRIVIVHILHQAEADVNNSDNLLSRLPQFYKC